MAAALPLILAAGAAMSAIGSIQQGESQAKAANYNAAVEEQNAKNALQVANANEEAQRRKSAGDLGRMRASLAENGLSLTEGTGADLYTQSDKNAEMDALNIRYGGTVQNVNSRNQAQLFRMNASSARTAGYIGAASAFLSAGGSYALSKGGGSSGGGASSGGG